MSLFIRFTNDPAYRTSTGPDPVAAADDGVAEVVGAAAVVGAAVLLELPHPAATRDALTSMTAPNRTCLRVNDEELADLIKGTVAGLVVRA
jgi:hypothetical protein